LQVWSSKPDIDNPAKVTFEERLDSDPSSPYPVLESDAGRYRIALTWQSADFRDYGVDTAWTRVVAVRTMSVSSIT